MTSASASPDGPPPTNGRTPWRPLAGVRVLDLSRLLPGGFATMLLADLGAQIDKVEPPKGGDYLRGLPPHVEGVNAAFHLLHRGKRSVAIDLRDERGREMLLRLLPRYDVLVESFRPGVMARLGLAPATLCARHERLVLCSLSGYGQQGPLAGRAGHDLNFLARSGALGATADPRQPPPPPPPMQAADVGGALYAVTGIVAALAERERTGRGRWLDVALADAAAGFGLLALAFAWASPDYPARHMLSGGMANYALYRTADDGFVSLAALEPKFWKAFCEAAGVPHDPSALLPGPHHGPLREYLAERFAQAPRSHWEAVAERADCCLEPVLRPEELPDDPQHRARGTFAGQMADGLPRLATPLAAAAPGRAPELGEHTAEVLAEAGLSQGEVSALREAGVIA